MAITTHTHTEVWLGEYEGQKVTIMMRKYNEDTEKVSQQHLVEAAIMT